MISLFDFFASLNKIALAAFVAVLGLLLYEVKKMVDDKRKKETPKVPKLDLMSAGKPVVQSFTPLPKNVVVAKKSNNSMVVIVLGILALGIVMVFVYMAIQAQMQAKKQVPIPVVTHISSAGLKLYDQTWHPITAYNTTTLPPGKPVYIGIETIVEADIDRARIRVNSKDWTIPDITTAYNPTLKVYYKEYTIATGTATLQIDAQLHSASDGWLGD